jgi:DNA-binding transcriptional ArsR family regulator
MPARPEYVARDVNVVPTALLLAEPARAAMLTALMDDRPLAAGELARLAGVSPATASAHLARLLGGGLVTVVSQGRHRYYRLAGPEVAAALEALAQLSSPAPVRSLRESRDAAALAQARTCYDHLAGRAGVALLDALLARGLLTPAPDGGQLAHGAGSAPVRTPAPDGGRPANPAGPVESGEPRPHTNGGRPGNGAAPQARGYPARYAVTVEGLATFSPFGIDIGALERTGRRFAGPCLDWTERRPHLNGALGAAITARLLELRWIERGTRRRAVRVTPAGAEGLAATFGWSPDPR